MTRTDWLLLVSYPFFTILLVRWIRSRKALPVIISINTPNDSGIYVARRFDLRRMDADTILQVAARLQDEYKAEIIAQVETEKLAANLNDERIGD